jgi:hypothetical protein
MTAILLDIPPMEAIKFAVTMALTIGLAYVVICGTDQ